MDSINLLGLRVDNVTMSGALKIAEEFISSKKPHLCVTSGLDCLLQIKDDSMLYKAVTSADLVIPDATSLVWLSKIFGTPLKERVTGLDLTLKLCVLSGKKGYKLYLLGSTNETLEKTVKVIENKYKARVAGAYSPLFGPWDEIEDKIIKDINEKSPDVLLVATGIGKGEKWLYKNLKKLNVPFCMQIGGTFDVICGNKKRASVGMQKIGLEGICYMVHQPWRIKKFVKNIESVLPDVIRGYIRLVMGK